MTAVFGIKRTDKMNIDAHGQNHKMKATILLTTYATRKTVLPTVYALLNQEFAKDQFEIIITDSEWLSTEDKFALAHICKDNPNLLLRSFENKNSAESYNASIQESNGTHILFIAPHCIPKRNWLKNWITLASKHENFMAAGHIECIDSKYAVGIYEKNQHERIIAKNQDKKENAHFDYHNSIAERKLIMENGMFDTTFTSPACVTEFGLRHTITGGKIAVIRSNPVHHLNEIRLSTYCKLAYADGFDAGILNLKYAKNEKFRTTHPTLMKHLTLLNYAWPAVEISARIISLFFIATYFAAHIIRSNNLKQHSIYTSVKNSHRLGQLKSIRLHKELI